MVSGRTLQPVRVLIDYRPALRHRTGVGEYIHQLIRAMAELPGSDLTVTAFSSSWRDRLDPARDLAAGTAVIDRRVPVHLLNFCWHRLEWPAIERLAGQRFDIVHSPHPLLIPTRHAARIVTIHDLDFLDHPERTRAEIRRDYPALAKRHAGRADGIIVSSRYMAARVAERLEVSSSKIAICPAGAPDWTARAQAPDEGHILFIGTLEPRKNIGTLLAAYEQLLARRERVPPLVLAGRSTPEAGAWLAAIERPPLAGHVRHVGYVEADERRSLYRDARVVAIPSLEEGFGLPALEAMSMGVPVVASNRGALPEVLGEAGLLVSPERPDDLAAGLAQVLFEPGCAATLTSKGLARARAFTWRATAECVSAAYAEAVARRAGTVGSRL